MVNPGVVALQALKKVPGVNASWHGDFIRQYHNIDISIAVQTPSGLMVPVVKDSDSKGLTEIGSAVKDLAGKVCGDDLLSLSCKIVCMLGSLSMCRYVVVPGCACCTGNTEGLSCMPWCL